MRTDVDLFARAGAVDQLALHDPRHEEHRAALSKSVRCIRTQIQVLIPMGRVDEQEPFDLVGILAREVLHVETAERMPYEYVRRLDASSLQLRTQLGDDRGRVTRAARRIAPRITGAGIGHRARAAGGDQWLNVGPDVQRVTEACLEDDRERPMALDSHLVPGTVAWRRRDTRCNGGHDEQDCPQWCQRVRNAAHECAINQHALFLFNIDRS